MRFQSGKFEGKSYEEIVLKNPDYVQYMVSKLPDSKVSSELRRLVRLFNQKPFTEKCSRCERRATRTSVYHGTDDPMFWCDECDHYGTGARSGMLSIVKTYGEALEQIDWYANGKRSYKRSLVSELARGKGLPKRVGERQALEFFC